MSGELTLEQLRRLGEVIQRHREARGLNKAQAARRCGVSTGYWNMIEQGGKPVAGEGRKAVKVSAGTLLQVVWGLNLNATEQAELFDIGGHPELKPQEIKPPDLMFLGDASAYTIGELREMEDQLARLRFKKEEKQRTRGARARGRGDDDA